MKLKNIEKLDWLEWFDTFIRRRIINQKNQNIPNKKLIEIYEKQVRWNDKKRIEIARKLI